MSSSNSDKNVPGGTGDPAAPSAGIFTFGTSTTPTPAAKALAPGAASPFGITAADVTKKSAESATSAPNLSIFTKYATGGTSLFGKPATSGMNNGGGGLFGSEPTKSTSLFGPDSAKSTSLFGQSSSKPTSLFGNIAATPTGTKSFGLFGNLNDTGSGRGATPGLFAPATNNQALPDETSTLSSNNAPDGPMPHPMFAFDPDGVTINVTYNGIKVVGNVSPYAMAMASPVWKSLIYPHTSQGHHHQAKKEQGIEELEEHRDSPKPALCAPSAASEIDFLEDDGDALLLILQIVHLRFGDIPTATLPYHHKVAVFCNKYNCGHLAKPWLGSWLQGNHPTTVNSNYIETLFTAWTFGDEKLFDQIAIFMVKNNRSDGSGRFLTHAGLPFTTLLPSGTIGEYLILPQCFWVSAMSESVLNNDTDRIKSARLAVIDQLTRIVYNAIDMYANSKDILCTQKKEGCHDITLGSLIRNARKIELWPRKGAKNIHVSVETLARQIQGFALQGFSHDFGVTCSPKFNPGLEVMRILQNIPSPAGDSEREHLAQKKAKMDNKQ
ncbi:uncharacterized protein PAC_14561 [Phialocephala subalpina]|uniref:Uncharacterized protein n=1 Tax=Phialocephala subalpina TaxID=576137 RepID=A0A1L7XHZ5_9HELO|nr:uncharacterized protein PAC_14561 [Phialocephala subalpina]